MTGLLRPLLFLVSVSLLFLVSLFLNFVSYLLLIPSGESVVNCICSVVGLYELLAQPGLLSPCLFRRLFLRSDLC